MALTIGQLASASYPSVVLAMRKPDKQWGDSTAMQAFEDLGFVKRTPGGPTIEVPLDYRRNQGAGFQDFDLDPLAMGKTEVLTSASYTPIPFSVPVVWSKADDAENPSENQKYAFVKALLENGINSHDDTIEQALFTTTTSGFTGFQTVVPDSGQGTVGGISGTTESFWRNQTGSYLDDATDIVAQATVLYNACAKGSSADSVPKLWLSDGATSALFESTQVPQQRYEGQTLKAGALKLMFKTCRIEFSLYGGTRVNLLNPKAIKLVIFNGAWREKGDTQEINNAQGYRMFLFSMCQLVDVNRSRLGVMTQTAS